MLGTRSARTRRGAGTNTGTRHQRLTGPDRPAINRLPGNRGTGRTRSAGTRSAGCGRHRRPWRSEFRCQVGTRRHHRTRGGLPCQGTSHSASRRGRRGRSRRRRTNRFTRTRPLRHDGRTLRSRSRRTRTRCFWRRRRERLAWAGKNLSWFRTRGCRRGRQRLRRRRRRPPGSKDHRGWCGWCRCSGRSGRSRRRTARDYERRMHRPSCGQRRTYRRGRLRLFRCRMPFFPFGGGGRRLRRFLYRCGRAWRGYRRWHRGLLFRLGHWRRFF